MYTLIVIRTQTLMNAIEFECEWKNNNNYATSIVLLTQKYRHFGAKNNRISQLESNRN